MKVYLTFVVEDHEYPEYRSIHATLEGAIAYVKKELLDCTCVKITERNYKGASYRVYISEEEVSD